MTSYGLLANGEENHVKLKYYHYISACSSQVNTQQLDGCLSYEHKIACVCLCVRVDTVSLCLKHHFQLQQQEWKAMSSSDTFFS